MNIHFKFLLAISFGVTLAQRESIDAFAITESDGVGCRYNATNLPGCKPKADETFVSIESPDECRVKCNETDNCLFWTHIAKWKECDLRKGRVAKVQAEGSPWYTSGSTLPCEEAERFQDAGRSGNPRKNDQECSYRGTVLSVHLGDAGNVTTDDTCGLPRTHGGLGTETASAEHCRNKCLEEVHCHYWTYVDGWKDDCYLWPKGNVSRGGYGPTSPNHKSGSFGVECIGPADCVWDIWRWDPCNVNCGNGTQAGTRKILVPSKNGGKDCEGPTEEEKRDQGITFINDQGTQALRSCTRKPFECQRIGEFNQYVDEIRTILEKLGCNNTAITDLEKLQICGRTGKSLLVNNVWVDKKESAIGLLKKACPAVDVINPSTGIDPYKRLCEDDSWKKMRGIRFNDLDGEVHCKGHRPSQFIWESAVCDGRIDCIDRSDEDGCHGTNHELDDNLLTILKPLRRQPLINVTQFDMKRSVPVPGEVPNQQDSGKQVAIGDRYLSVDDLCSVWTAQHLEKAFNQSDHIALCQNFTYWNLNKRENLTRFSCDKVFPCTGNFPGFSTCANYSFGNGDETFARCNKEAYCPDLSDVKCQLEDCKENLHFKCTDNSGCIHNSLVCDGHEQCPDGSDEKQDCDICPKAIGHPPRPISQQWAANWKCRHRYTGRDICAIRCDRRDDLCEGFSDEQDCGEVFTWWAKVLTAIIIVFSLAVIFKFVDKIIVRKQKWVESRRSRIENMNFSEMSEFSEYMERRAGRNFGAALGNDIFLHATQHDPVAMRQFCLRIYSCELRHQMEDEKSQTEAIALTNEFFYEKLGTFDTTSIFFDNVNDSIFVRSKCFLASRAPKVWELLNNFYAIKVEKMVHYLASIFAYYFDLIKDVLLITFMVKVFMGNSGASLEFFTGLNLPAALFSGAILSVTFALIVNVMSVLNFKPWNWTQRALGALLILFIPGAIRYRNYRISSNMALRYKSNVDLFKDRYENQALSGLKAELRCNENSIEQLSQLVILILLVLIRSSATVTVPNHFAANLLKEDQDYFLVGSAIWSFISLVRGQLNLGVSIDRGIVPILGKGLLFAYYFIGTFARMFAFVLFLTPNLGLLDTRHHSFSGRLCAEMEVGVYDIQNGNVKFFGQLWNDNSAGYTLGEACSESRDNGTAPKDFYRFPKEVMVCAVPLLLILHLTLSLIFFKALYFGSLKLKEVSWYKRFSQILHTLLCPPVHWDWEVLHRLRGGSLSISDCWRKTKRLLIAFNILLFIEHLLLMVPLMVLKGAIDQRNALLSKDFPPTSDELISTGRVDLLLFCGTLAFVVLPFLSLLLAYTYFRKWHLWSGILNRHVQGPQLKRTVPCSGRKDNYII